MSWDWLRRAEGPWIRLAPTGPGECWDALQHEARRWGLALRVLRGSHMRDEASLMDEFAAACQLPPHFGANWDALDECLADLDIAQAEGVVLGILDADQLLAEAPPESGRILFDILARVAEAQTRDSHAIPFHTVLQVEPGLAAPLEARLRTLGIAAERV